MKFQPFTNLFNDEIVLSALNHNDIEDLWSLRSNKTVNQHLLREPPKGKKELKEFIDKIKTGEREGKWIYWSIKYVNSNHLLGTICLWNFNDDYSEAEIGYELHPTFQGKGVMKNAAFLVVDYGINKLKLNRILASTSKENTNSIGLLLRLKFTEILPIKIEEGRSFEYKILD